MDPEKRKRSRQKHEEWLRTDPLNIRLRARIDELKRRLAERDAQDERREAS
jgi:hypothetical protein